MTITGKIISFIIIAGLIGGGAYYVTRGTTQAVPASSETMTGQPSAKKIAFSEFVKQGGSYVCQVTQTANGMTTTGTVHVYNNKLRGEFSTTVQGQNLAVTTIVKDGFSYTWTSMMPTTGFKAKVATDTTGTGAAASGSYTWDNSLIGDYSCDAQTVEATLFDLPTTITFKEV